MEENLNRRVLEEGSVEARTIEEAIAVLRWGWGSALLLGGILAARGEEPSLGGRGGCAVGGRGRSLLTPWPLPPSLPAAWLRTRTATRSAG